jgi:hypothetical protein
MRQYLRLTLLVAAWSAPVSAQIPETFTNLQVLPNDIPQQRLVSVMRSFAINLGVRCEHCHVGEGNDLSKFDFASDARAPKNVARKMMALVSEVNTNLNAAIGPAPDSQIRVTCYTCHRGAAKPLTAPPEGRGGGSRGADLVASHIDRR